MRHERSTRARQGLVAVGIPSSLRATMRGHRHHPRGSPGRTTRWSCGCPRRPSCPESVTCTAPDRDRYSIAARDRVGHSPDWPEAGPGRAATAARQASLIRLLRALGARVMSSTSQRRRDPYRATSRDRDGQLNSSVVGVVCHQRVAPRRYPYDPERSYIGRDRSEAMVGHHDDGAHELCGSRSRPPPPRRGRA